MNFYIVTLFPQVLDSYLKESIIGRAVINKKIKVEYVNPRDFIKSKNTYKQVDDRPYGGGPGMILQAEPLVRAIDFIKNKKIKGKNHSIKIIFFLASGKKFDNQMAIKLAKKYTDVIFICGHYEGVDARVKKIFNAEAISIGDYILTGGELPAGIMIDAITRQIPEILNKEESLEEKRISASEVYTRPEVLIYKGKKYRVPKVLLSGNHKKIEEWKLEH